MSNLNYSLHCHVCVKSDVMAWALFFRLFSTFPAQSHQPRVADVNAVSHALVLHSSAYGFPHTSPPVAGMQWFSTSVQSNALRVLSLSLQPPEGLVLPSQGTGNYF